MRHTNKQQTHDTISSISLTHKHNHLQQHTTHYTLITTNTQSIYTHKLHSQPTLLLYNHTYILIRWDTQTHNHTTIQHKQTNKKHMTPSAQSHSHTNTTISNNTQFTTHSLQLTLNPSTHTNYTNKPTSLLYNHTYPLIRWDTQTHNHTTIQHKHTTNTWHHQLNHTHTQTQPSPTTHNSLHTHYN